LINFGRFDKLSTEVESEFSGKLQTADRLARARRSRGNGMRIFVASLIVLAVLYLYDAEYNNGALFDGLRAMIRSISHGMLH
jgi:hypothetical protein